ncbi:Hypothetical predicted protein [Paramuricea clavata]|uniref:Uncharacterized protein n=1 Tax=Paramuricea clavata TaxID=317549 RepID=A0A6S7I6X3_PARCT|nr:Hypothetical predicted protein [Paramuricea clavata]
MNPVLWSLYATCSYLYGKKRIEIQNLGVKEICIRNYRRASIYALAEEEDGEMRVVEERSLMWMKGSLTGVRDVMLYDKAQPSYVLLGVDTEVCDTNIYEDNSDDEDDPVTHKTFYIIPAEWMPYVYIRFKDDESWCMYLAKKKFCCWQILCRGDVTVVRREHVSIKSEYMVCEDYFHVGVGLCATVVHEVLADVGIFINAKQLYNAVRRQAEPYGKTQEVIYALGVHEPIFKFGDEQINGKTLKFIMKHLLVCKCCNVYVDKLVEMICTTLVKHDTLPGVMNSAEADKLKDGLVPCYTYIMDGDFVVMRKDAYRAPLKINRIKWGSKNICKEIVDPFFEKLSNYSMDDDGNDDDGNDDI